MNAQAAATTAIGKNVVGWKIALTPIGSAIAAPILDAQTVDSAASAEVGKVGAKAIEVEICFVLNRDLPQPQSGKPYTREDALNAIGSIHLGVELISFRIDRKNEVPLSLFLADRLGNHSYVIGPEISDDIVNRLASGDTSTLSLRVDDGGNNKFSGIPGHPQVDPLLPLIAYMNNPCDRLGGLRKGQFATTGSLCGVIPVQPGSSLDISGKMLPEMKLTFCDRYHAKSHVT
jgi:2-keto-4-pentenoate hydratase